MENRVHVLIAAGQAARSVAWQLVQSLLRGEFTQASRRLSELRRRSRRSKKSFPSNRTVWS